MGVLWHKMHVHVVALHCGKKHNFDVTRVTGFPSQKAGNGEPWCLFCWSCWTNSNRYANDFRRQHAHGTFMMTSSNGNIFRVTTHLCGNSPFRGEFPAQRPVTRSLDVFFDLRFYKRLSKQSWGRWFETPSRPLWRHCDDVTCSFGNTAANLLDQVHWSWQVHNIRGPLY